ncbi:unnamed protein product [Rotaria magnacalcarata]
MGGEHTWDSKLYYHDDNKNVLKEIIFYGHALILLDGLDEIVDVRQKREIVDLVKNFVAEYVHDPDFFSAFDDEMFSKILINGRYHDFVETKSPSTSGGNQILITSRIVGYQLHPLVGTSMCHYTFLLMNDSEVKKFMGKCLSSIEKKILEILLNEGINLDHKLLKTLSKRKGDVVKALLENNLELLSNPCLLSLICTFIFQSCDELNHKSRVEVYDHAVQVALRSWKSHKSNIPEIVLHNFLINLACYLHLNSPSGLIDEFDAKRLCYLTLQQQNLSDDHKILRDYANELTSLLDFNIGIFAERGLKVFGFLHLSFQDYFVAQALVKGSVEEVAKRILTITIHPRLHESLLLAFGWIAWKWPFDDYDRFCYLLVTLSTEYSIPFGTILFFDALNGIQSLPSNSVIFLALNNILDHSYYPSRTAYLISNLLKLPENIIMEWMQTNLTEEKRLSNFCQCLLQNAEKSNDKIEINQKPIPSTVYRQLWLLHDISASAELMIDRTLRILMRSIDNIPDQIFNKDLSSYLLSNDITMSNIHPLIVSVIIAVCGGICLRDQHGKIQVDFSIQQMHRQCSILAPIIEYFTNNKDSHSLKIHTPIKYYENIIQKSLPSDSSNDVVDSFIALICLRGLSQPLIYQKYDKYEALALAFNRLKQTCFYIKESFNTCIPHYDESQKISLIKSDIETIIYTFFLQSDESDEQRISFSVACAAAWKKLDLWNEIVWYNNRDNSYSNEHKKYLQYQEAFSHLIIEDNLDEMIINIHSQKELLLLLNILPQSLQQLYYNAMMTSTNDTNSFSTVLFLSQCLIHLEHFEKGDFNIYLAVLMLYPLLKEYMLENYGLIFYQEKCSSLTSVIEKECNTLYEWIQNSKLLDPFITDQAQDLTKLISIEYNRIHEARQSIESQQKNCRLFAASISLARLLQSKYRGRRCTTIHTIAIDSIESKALYLTIKDILDPVLRIIALSTIVNLKDPLIFDEEKDSLEHEMAVELYSLLPCVSLITATIIFIRCYDLCTEKMAYIIVEKFNDKSLNKQSPIKEAVFIALRQLKNANLSHCLSRFAKQKNNLSDLFRLNSTIFFRYFNKTISFDSSNNILLSLMYLLELTFDIEILRMNVSDNHENPISPLRELKQFWNESTKSKKIMTYKFAMWITKNLQTLSKQGLQPIIQDVSNCLKIERKALIVIEKWLDYRLDNFLKVFAHYAALQLFIEGSNIPDLIDIINEMFCIADRFIWKSIIENLIESPLVNSNAVRQILIILNENACCHLSFSVLVSSEEMLDLFLGLELKRVISNVQRSSTVSFNSFLSMISDRSSELKHYLLKNLPLYLNFQRILENAIKDEYFAAIIEWLSKKGNCRYWRDSDYFFIELYKYIMKVSDVQKYPLFCKVIVNALDKKYYGHFTESDKILLQNDIIIDLEEMICSSYSCSEAVLAACLLAYGNYLIHWHKFKMSRNISDAMKEILTIISERSPSDVNSIRANFCLLFIESSDITYLIIQKWFQKKSKITTEQRYNILLQQTLYNLEYSTRSTMTDEIIDNLQTHSTELIDLFVIDLYNYLYNRDEIDYLSDRTPIYIGIAADISSSNGNEFRDAIRRSLFGEIKFKRELYFCCKKHPHDSETLIQLYADFGTLTIDLVEMCEEYALNSVFFGVEKGPNLNNIKDCDRSVIDELFQVFDSKVYNRKLKSSLWLLKYLVDNHMISLLEVHQRISIVSYIFDCNDNLLQKTEECIFDLLLDTSCFNKGVFSDFNQIAFSKSDIDEEFEKKLDFLDKKLILFPIRNNF